MLCTVESLHEYTAKARRQAKRESSFSNNLNAKLQSMTLQTSPSKSVTSFNAPFSTISVDQNKTSPTVPTINIQGSSPGHFSPKARTSSKRPSRSPSPSAINASLQNSFKFASNMPPSSNPLPPIASQGYFSAPQPQLQQQQSEFLPQNIPAYFAQHQQPRTQSQFFPMPSKQQTTQFSQMSQPQLTQMSQPQLTQMPQVNQPPPQFSFPSAAVPVMFKPQSYQTAQPTTLPSHPAQYQPYNLQQHTDLQQQYMHAMQAQYQHNYAQYYQQAYQDINQQLYPRSVYPQQQPVQHAPYQYVAAEQAIHHDLSLSGSNHNITAHSVVPKELAAVPNFSFPSGKQATRN